MTNNLVEVAQMMAVELFFRKKIHKCVLPL
jgi:hypothetical protein